MYFTKIQANLLSLGARSVKASVFKSYAGMKNTFINLMVLQGKKSFDTLDVPSSSFIVSRHEFNLGNLLDSAVRKRADLQVALKNMDVSEKVLKLLKAERAFEFSIEAGYPYKSIYYQLGNSFYKYICFMNVSSLSLTKILIMKASLFIKIFLVLPLILLADYVLMALFGCTTCLFGLGDEFYCGPFCLIGKIILALSALFFGYLIYPDIKGIFKHTKNVKTAESTESK